jgi:hypothetical protein
VRTTTPSGSKSKAKAPARPGGEAPAAKISRAQVKAMEARSTATPVEITGQPALAAPAVSPTRATSVSSKRITYTRPIVLTKEQEYAYIREDMRRLVIIASGLLVLMLVLLFILD